MLKISNAKVIKNTVCQKNVYIENGKIYAVTNENLNFDNEIDAKGCYLSAGFIDTHLHGGGGHDFSDGTKQAIITAAKTHLKHGTTTLYPTTLTCSKEDLEKLFSNLYEVKNNEDLPNIPGVHMEGPYISPAQAGAQNKKYIVPPCKEDYEEILKLSKGLIKKWTFAPELCGSEEFCKFLTQNGILPSIGHTDATIDDVKKVYALGVKNFTHLYSSMSDITRKNGYRILGAIQAAYILEDTMVEVIADGFHLPSDLLKMIYKFKGADNICLITDAMRGADMPDGESMIGSLNDGVPCIIEDGIAKMPDRTCFAGSVATTDRLLKTMYKNVGIDIVNCIKMLTETPAKNMGLTTKGKICENYDADLVIFDDDINIKKVILSKSNKTKIINLEE